MIRALSFASMAVALVALQLTAGPALAKKHHYYHHHAAPAASAAVMPAFGSSPECPGGLSRGCSPGNCRCP